MYYKIQKSLGDISAVYTKDIPEYGTCIGIQNFKITDSSIVIYQGGSPKDLCINGFTFHCVYNNIGHSYHKYFGCESFHYISFEFIDPNGSVKSIIEKDIYGGKESTAVEYFYSLLYNISCCESIEQFKQLYKYIIDNNRFKSKNSCTEAVEVINFIESFTPQLAKVKDTDYLPGLKRKLQEKFKEAQKIIASSECPL